MIGSSRQIGRGASGSFAPGSMRRPSSSYTQRQQELYPIVQQLKEQKERQTGWLQPVEFVFDILQRGNYLSANTVKAIMDLEKDGIPPEKSLQYVLSEAWDGLSGEDKTIFSDILPASLDKPWLQNKAGEDIPFLTAITNPKNVLGFGLDVALDPLTYVGAGASRKALAAASKYADDSVRLALKDPDTLSKMTNELMSKVQDKGKVTRIIEEGKGDPRKLFEIMKKYNASDHMNRMYKRYYREGLRLSEAQGKSNIAKKLRFTPEYEKKVDDIVDRAVRGNAKDKARRKIDATFMRRGGATVRNPSRSTDPQDVWKQIRGDLDPDALFEMKREVRAALTDPEKFEKLPWRIKERLHREGFTELNITDKGTISAGFGEWVSQPALKELMAEGGYDSAYAGLGKRTWQIMGKDVLQYAEGSTAGTRFTDAVAKKLSESPIGSASRAIAARLDNGAVGTLRKMFGFRSPYEKMLRAKELDTMEAMGPMLKKQAVKIQEQFGSYDEALKQKFIQAKGRADKIRRVSGNDFTFESAIQEMAEKGQITAQEKTTLRYMNSGWEDIAREWREQETQWAKEGLIKGYSEREEYIPFLFKDLGSKKYEVKAKGAYAPGPTQASTKGIEQGLDEQAEVFGQLFGINEEVIKEYARKEGLPTIEMNFDHILMHRAYAHARMAKRADFVRGFREFAINKSEVTKLSPEWGERLDNPNWSGVLGLQEIDDLGLEGYLFDKDVAAIADRTLGIIDDEGAFKKVLKAFDNRTQWWKAVVTTSPGFHMRNMASNFVTGFMKHGHKWLNPQLQRDSMVVTYASLHGEEAAKKALARIGMKDDAVNRILNRSYGKMADGREMTLRELMPYLRRKGIVSESVQGFDEDLTIRSLLGEKQSNWNPASVDFAAFHASHAAGSVIESSSRVQSFLTDIKTLTNNGQEELTEAALEFGKLEAKKWFLDYNDLTWTERNILKRSIPFYSWIRKNLANQVSMLMDPNMWGKLALQPKGINMVADRDASTGELYPYQRERGEVPIGRNEAGPITFWPNVPIMDLNRIPITFGKDGSVHRSMGEVASDLFTMAHPVIRNEVENFTGRDMFREADMPYNTETSKLLGVLNRHPKAAAFIDGALKMAGLEDGLAKETDEKGHLLINSKVANSLENYVPIIRQLERFLDGPEELLKMGGVDFENTLNHALNAWGKDENTDQPLKEIMNIISFYTGIKFNAIDEEKKWFWDSQELLKQAEDMRRRSKKYTPGYENRSLRWRGQQGREMRRLGL